MGLYALAASDVIDKLETPLVDLAFKLHNVLGADKLIMLVPLSIGRYASIAFHHFSKCLFVQCLFDVFIE